MHSLDSPARPAGAIPGPSSLTWRYAGDWRGVFGARSTLLLQVAHPVVGVASPTTPTSSATGGGG